MRSIHKLGQTSVGQVLRAEGLISADQLDEVLTEHQATGEPISDIVLERGLSTEYDIAKAMVRQLHMAFISTRAYAIPEGMKDLMPPAFLHEHGVVPLDRFGNLLVLATSGDIAPQVMSEIESTTSCRLSLFVALKSDLRYTLDQEFPMEDLGQEVASRLDQLFGS